MALEGVTSIELLVEAAVQRRIASLEASIDARLNALAAAIEATASIPVVAAATGVAATPSGAVLDASAVNLGRMKSTVSNASSTNAPRPKSFTGLASPVKSGTGKPSPFLERVRDAVKKHSATAEQQFHFGNIAAAELESLDEDERRGSERSTREMRRADSNVRTAPNPTVRARPPPLRVPSFQHTGEVLYSPVSAPSMNDGAPSPVPKSPQMPRPPRRERRATFAADHLETADTAASERDEKRRQAQHARRSAPKPERTAAFMAASRRLSRDNSPGEPMEHSGLRRIVSLEMTGVVSPNGLAPTAFESSVMIAVPESAASLPVPISASNSLALDKRMSIVSSAVGGSRADGASSAVDDLDASASASAPASPTAAATPKVADSLLELRRGLSETHWLITIADVGYVVFAMLSIVIATFQVHPNGVQFRADGMFHMWVVGYNAFAQVFTLVWIATRFLLAKRRGSWEIIDDLPGIRKHYLKTWFFYDMLYGFPLDFIFVVWQWETYKWLQLRHFLRLPRILALGSSHNPLLSTRLWFRFMSFCFMMCLTMHLLGSIFWGVEASQYTYEESLYWAIATMTSIGYGDIIPTSTGARLYVCFACLFGIGMLSTMTAFATSFLTSKDKLTEETESKKLMMYSMLDYYDVPWDVQKEVIGAVPALIENDNEQTFKEMTSQLPPFVAKKINGYIRAKMLRVVPIFKRINNIDVLLDLSSKLHQQFFPTSEPIIQQGETDRVMYFLVRGVVEVLITKPSAANPNEMENVTVAVLQTGAFFGEVNLLRGGRRGATVKAMTLCEVLALSQPDFEAFMDDHPEVRDIFADELAARVVTVDRQNAAVAKELKSPTAAEMTPLFASRNDSEVSTPQQRSPNPQPLPAGVPGSGGGSGAPSLSNSTGIGR
jgi:CRP-like cAMP-binding protein